MNQQKVVAFIVDHSLSLVAGTVVALLWANLAFDSYARLTHALHFLVNDVGMVFFFAVAAKEVYEATLPGGPLSSLRRAAIPLLAAAGGMLIPALIYVTLVMWFDERALLRGWAIPSATDIAFSYLVARFIFGARHPALPFLLLLAIADDALGLLILAVFYTTGELHPLRFGLLLGSGAMIAYGLQRRGVMTLWPYLAVAGSLSWVGFYVGGFHPALALVPIVPFIPHARRDTGLFDARVSSRDPLNRLEHLLKVPVQVLLLFFGLVNAGVPFAAVGMGTWIVLGALVAGKPIGIGLSVGTALLMGLHRSAHMRWADLVVVGCVAGIGFTVALFFATAAFPPGALLDQTKMGAVFSVGASLLALTTARVLRVGRFSAG